MSKTLDIDHLTQADAAALLGRSPRWLRDQRAPRRADGTYSGPELLTWRLTRLTAAELADGIGRLTDDRGILAVVQAASDRAARLLRDLGAGEATS